MARGHVEQEQIAGTALVAVRDVVQSAGVQTTGDDGRVGKAAAAADELVRQFRLDLDLVHAGFHKFQQALEAAPREVAGVLQRGDFRLRLHHAELVHHARQPLVIMQRILPHHVRHETRLARFDFDVRALVLVRVQINVLALAHQAVEERGEFTQPMHARHAARRARLLLRQLVAFPRFEQRMQIADEEDLALLLVVRVRVEEEDALLLLEAGEVKQIRMRHEPQRAVGVGGKNVVGVHHGEGVGLQHRLQTRAVLGEQRGRKLAVTGLVLHGRGVWAGDVKNSKGEMKNGARAPH